ncbi:MAG: hypothetical protein FIO04_04005 [Nitrosopumilales archaeon]|nr:hypothetical protein [Nitrosopumilales archaeon]
MSTKKEEQKQDSRSSGATNPQEAKSRRDATTIAKKLETLVDEKEGKKYSVDQQSHGMIKALDESKENIRQGINEAKAEIPRFTQIVKDFQETAIESTKEISDAFIESQRQVISSLQSVWIPSLANLYGSIWNYWTLQPIVSDIYVSMVRITADNVIATTRLANNIIFTSIEAAKALMPQLKDNAKELLRLSENAAKSFEQTSRRALNPD